MSTALSVYKPRGLTRYGRRKENEQPELQGSATSTPRWVYASGSIIILLIVLFVILHLAGGGFGHH
jgi:hypothetical protein